MIEFHYLTDDKRSEELLEEIDRMVINVKRVKATDSAFPDEQLPLFKEHDAIYSSKEEVQGFLDELNGQLKVERTVSGDSCYINPATGEKC